MKEELTVDEYLQILRDKIVKLLYFNSISEKELSLALDKNSSYINKITRGKSNPSMTEFLNICSYFNINPSDFFDPDNKNPVMISEMTEKLKKLNEKDLKLIDLIIDRMLE